MKKILGLDLGTNSIGWSIIEHDAELHQGRILGIGSRIIPMTQDVINEFGKGNSVSKTAERTKYRSIRRLRERFLLRRERLIKVLKKLNWIDDDFDPKISKISYKLNEATGRYEFQFEESYQEMLSYFKSVYQSEMKIPRDWTIYYLRKKALSQMISPTELSWVIMQFNQKRGYYELRSEKEEQPEDNKEFIKAAVVKISETGDKRGRNKILELTLDNGMTGTLSSNSVPDWIGQEKELIATKKELKDGTVNITFSFPDENDWTLRKKKTESLIDSKKKTVGEYILEVLVNNPDAKIRGKEVHTIERKYYVNELQQILKKQSEYHTQLRDKDLFLECINLLYPNNEEHRNMLKLQDFIWLFVKDILFYQRPLRSKKYLIDGCKFERRYHIKNDELIETRVKVIPKSHPLYQEFRIWQLLHNLKVLKIQETDASGKIFYDVDETDNYLTDENKEKLFHIFNESNEVSPARILKTLGLDNNTFKINYEADTKLPGNSTVAGFISGFKKADAFEEGKSFLSNQQNTGKLWHILYSLEKKDFVIKALGNPELRFPKQAISIFAAMPAFKKDYGAYSAKAVKRLLPLMKCGKLWSQKPIEDIIPKFLEWKNTAEYKMLSPKIKGQLDKLEAIEEFQGLSLTLAEYVAYQSHSEEREKLIYNNPEDIKRLKQHSLRNPIVEQVINETLMVVRDIWKKYGKPDEIHLEMGRDMKNPANKRKEMNERRSENEKINLRAKAMLFELQKDNKSINPFSVSQLELFKLYEEGALGSSGIVDDEIFKITRKADPTQSEITKYKLWLDQKYRSPYTGKPIPLASVFTSKYEIEHIFPQARYFDDSFNNKVISESEVNREKGKKTAFEFISSDGGKNIKLSSGEIVTILNKDEYIDLVKKTFSHNKGKLKNLLSYDIPESFIQRQLNDTRYISREIKKYLSPVVRKENETEPTPVGLIPMVGSITDRIKEDWGIKQVWKEILIPRFRRMNEITNSTDYYTENIDNNGNRTFLLTGHKESVKRLDHRHHAMDALVIAAITRDHIHYLNALESEHENYSLIKKLKGYNQHNQPNKNFLKPWKTFTTDAKETLERTVVSFKNTIRVLNQGRNRNQKWEMQNNTLKKVLVTQSPDNLWAIRQPLHKETVFGKICLRQYKKVSLVSALSDHNKIADPFVRKTIHKLFIQFNNDVNRVKSFLKTNPLIINGEELKTVDIYYYDYFSSVRKTLDASFNEKMIEKVSNQRIAKILKSHLEKYDGISENAFSPEGIEDMNNQLRIPIKKVRVFESMGKKFQLGTRDNKSSKFVEAAKGTNLFFVVYENIETGERFFDENSSLPLKDVIELKKNGLPIAAEKPGYRWFVLSPGDLVYVPDCDENGNLLENIEHIDWENLTSYQINKIYIFEKSSGSSAYFIQHHVATLIKEYDAKTKIGEFESQNKSEKSIDGIIIKKVCIKLSSNRLGEVKPAAYDSYSSFKNRTDNNPGEFNESTVNYIGAKIEFFSSIQDENEATFKYMAERTPEENLRAANMIITALYRKELQNNEKPYTNITFLNHGLSD